MKKNYYPCTIKSKLIIFYFLSPNSEDTNVKLEQKNQTLKKKEKLWTSTKSYVSAPRLYIFKK